MFGDSLFIVVPILFLVFVWSLLRYSALLCPHLEGEERAGCLTLV